MTDSSASGTPAGWYPVDGRQERYWNGTEWSDQVRPSNTASQPERHTSPASTPGGDGTNNKAPWFKRTWVIGAAALLAGVVLGNASAGAVDPRDSSEYQEVSEELETVEDELDTAEEASRAAEQELQDIAGDLPAREEAVAQAEEALSARETAVEKAEAENKRAEKALLRRERAVGIAEKEIANNTIPGDGVFEVGVDMKAGNYKTAGTSGCYYAVLGDANGNNIKSNNIMDGPATVAVAAGEYFETRGCADWVLQP